MTEACAIDTVTINDTMVESVAMVEWLTSPVRQTRFRPKGGTVPLS